MQTEYIPNVKLLELCVTYRCNLACPNCSTLCSQSRCGIESDILVSQVQDLFDNASRAGWQFDLITIHGGEPSLHPQIETIAAIVVQHAPKRQILSNFFAKESRQLLSYISRKYDIALGIAEKTANQKHTYIPINESPSDIGKPFSNGCFQLSDCGICYNHRGFFPCSPMAAASRVFGYDPMFDNVNHLTRANIAEYVLEYATIHCRHCGFSSMCYERTTEQRTSESWRRMFDYAR